MGWGLLCDEGRVSTLSWRRSSGLVVDALVQPAAAPAFLACFVVCAPPCRLGR